MFRCVAGGVCHTAGGKQTLGKEKIVRISDVCVILQNIHIRYILEGLMKGEPDVDFLTEVDEDHDSNEGELETDLGAELSGNFEYFDGFDEN